MKYVYTFQGGSNNVDYRVRVRDALLKRCMTFGQSGEGYARLLNSFLM